MTYLSPEPLLRSPVYLRRMAQAGLSVPTYAYGLNNPLRYLDFDGLKPIRTFQDVQERRAQIASAYDAWWAKASVAIRDAYIGGDFVGNGPAWGQTLFLHNFYRELFGLPSKTMPGVKSGDGACGGAVHSLYNWLEQNVDMEDVRMGTPTGPWFFGKFGSHTTVQIDFATPDGTAGAHLGLDPFNRGVLPDWVEAGDSYTWWRP